MPAAVSTPVRPLPMSPVAILGSSLPPAVGADIVGSSSADARAVPKSDTKPAGRILAIDDDSRTNWVLGPEDIVYVPPTFMSKLGYAIEEVAQVTGNRSLDILWGIYTKLRPEKFRRR